MFETAQFRIEDRPMDVLFRVPGELKIQILNANTVADGRSHPILWLRRNVLSYKRLSVFIKVWRIYAHIYRFSNELKQNIKVSALMFVAFIHTFKQL